MTPNGKGSPSAPPLTPARRLSRTRSYLRAIVEDDGVYFTWRFDRHIGASWGLIMEFQKGRGRNVMGFSLNDWDEVVRRCDFYWKRNRIRWAQHGAASRGLDVAKVTAHLSTKPAAKPRVIGHAPGSKKPLMLDLPREAVAPPAPNVVRRPMAAPLRGVVTGPAEAALVRQSAATGDFSGWRRGPGPATSGPFVRKPVKKRAQ